MPHLSIPRRKPTAIAASAIMLLACAGLTACGGSSSTTTATTANAAATSTTTTTTTGASTATTPAGATTTPAGAPGSTTGPGAGRFAAVRECLQKNGVTLPARPAGGGPARRGGPGGFLGAGAGAGGGPTLPKGMTRAQYEEVLKKCGGGFRGPGAAGGRRSFDSPGFRRAITAFAACLRQNGIDVPAPNTNGKGPVFNTKGIDTTSPQFRQAEIKCRPVLLAGLRPRLGATGSGGGATGSSGGATG